MPWFRIILWLAFMSIGAYLVGKLTYFPDHKVESPLTVQSSQKNRATEILRSWGPEVRSEARLFNTVDYFFIALYVSVLINLSARRMNDERSLSLNNLLRFNILLAVIAGILDVSENVIFGLNLHKDFGGGAEYIYAAPITFAKFIVIIWIALVWIVSMTKWLFEKR